MNQKIKDLQDGLFLLESKLKNKWKYKFLPKKFLITDIYAMRYSYMNEIIYILYGELDIRDSRISELEEELAEVRNPTQDETTSNFPALTTAPTTASPFIDNIRNNNDLKSAVKSGDIGKMIGAAANMVGKMFGVQEPKEVKELEHDKSGMEVK